MARLTISYGFWKDDDSFSTEGARAPVAGAAGAADAAGASCTGADARCDFGAAGFLAAASAGATDAVGRGDSNRALSAVDADGNRAAAWPAAGSGVMMLTAGVEAAVGKSALVGLPVGTPGGSAASGPAAGVAAGASTDADADTDAAGAFQDGA